MTPEIRIPLRFGSRLGWHSRPVHARETNPFSASSRDTLCARFAGIAPPRLPIPTSLIPIIPPFLSTSGPPLLPGKMTASCPSHLTSSPTFSPSSRKLPELGEIMARLEMIPRVTDWVSPAGLPMAKQTSPTLTESESANLAIVSDFASAGRSFVLNLRTARSVIASAPNKSAITSSPS